MVESVKISKVVDGQSFHIWNFSALFASETFRPNAHAHDLRAEAKISKIAWIHFGDIGFLLAPCTGWKWQNFKCCWCAKFSPCHCTSKIPARLKLTSQMPTLKVFELRQRLRKSVAHLWRYRIFAGTVYRLKIAIFQMLSMHKVFTPPLQTQNTCAIEAFHPNAHSQDLRAKAKISEFGWVPLEI